MSHHHIDFPYFEHSHFISNAIIKTYNKKIYSPRLVCAKKIFFQLFLCAGADWVCVAHDEPETTHNFQKWGEREKKKEKKSSFAAAAAELAGPSMEY